MISDSGSDHKRAQRQDPQQRRMQLVETKPEIGDSI
jgi:hypothetical protein